MITLKPNCTAVSFKNMEKTKDNFLLLMYGYPDKEIIDQKIQFGRLVIESGHDSKGLFREEVDYFNKLRSDPNYQNGSLPRGVEEIILQIMESYTFWYSINEIDSKFFLAEDNFIHNLINVSLTFMVSCELAKLFNNKEDDFSLNNIWNHDVQGIRNADIVTPEEVDYITEQFARNEATRDPAIKRFLDFRNKSVAHNTNNTGMQWSDFIRTMNFIVRVWGVVDEYYSPNCIPRSIGLSDQIYAPLKPYFSATQIKEMQNVRLLLMKDIFKSASRNLITREQDRIKPFDDLKVTVEIESKDKLND